MTTASSCFASMWRDLDSAKARFGEHWQQSFLPEGYRDLIDECTVRYVDFGLGLACSAGRPIALIGAVMLLLRRARSTACGGGSSADLPLTE